MFSSESFLTTVGGLMAKDALQVFLMSAWSCTGSNASLPAHGGCLYGDNAGTIVQKVTNCIINIT